MCCEKSQHIFFVSGCWCYTRTSGTRFCGLWWNPTTVAAVPQSWVTSKRVPPARCWRIATLVCRGAVR